MQTNKLFRAILPDVLIGNFEVVNFEKRDVRFDIWLVESSDMSLDKAWQQLRSLYHIDQQGRPWAQDDKRNHNTTILNYFEGRQTNASAESFYAKIKALRGMFRRVRDIKFFMFRLATLYS